MSMRSSVELEAQHPECYDYTRIPNYTDTDTQTYTSQEHSQKSSKTSLSGPDEN